MAQAIESSECEHRPLGLRFVVDVLNEPPVTSADLQHMARAHQGPTVHPASFRRDEFRSAVESVRQVFAASDDARAASLINALLSRANAPTEVGRLDDGRWILRPAMSIEADPSLWFTAIAAFGLGQWMTERGRAAWGVCAAPDCMRVFVDAGRRRPQRYCSARCATRVRVSAHRESARPARTSAVDTSAS